MAQARAPRRLDRTQWLRALAIGRLTIELLIPGFDTQGTPTWPWGFTDRAIPFHVVYFVTHGGMRVRWAGQEAAVLPGSLFWMAPGTRHDLVLLRPGLPLTSYHMRLVARLADGTPVRLDDDVVIVRDLHGVQPLMEFACEEEQAGLHRAERLQGLFLHLFARAFEEERRAERGRKLTPAQQHALRRFADRQLARGVSAASLAREVGLSSDYFSRRFRATFGTTPRAWLTQERMRAAAIALTETRKPVTAIALELGYAEIYGFSRQFRKAMGCSPRTFRYRHLPRPPGRVG